MIHAGGDNSLTSPEPLAVSGARVGLAGVI